MALPATGVWQIRTDGDDTNGGGFNAARGGTDYSQQAAAQASMTALDCNGSVTVTCAINGFLGFTDAMKGNFIHIISGTSLTAGWYEIQVVNSTTSVDLDRSPGNSGGAQDGVAKVGGALASIGGLGAVFAASTSHATSGMKAYVRGGTYTCGSGTVNVPTGPLDLDAGYMDSLAFLLKGHDSSYTNSDRDKTDGTWPTISAGTQTITSMIELKGAAGALSHIAMCLNLDGNSGGGGAVTNGIIGNNTAFDRAILVNVTGVSGTQCFTTLCTFGCKASSSAANGFVNSSCLWCYAKACESSFANCYCGFCVANAQTTSGPAFYNSYGWWANCISYKNPNDGFESTTDRNACYINCLVYYASGGAYSFDTGMSDVLLRCAANAGGSGITPGAGYDPIISTGFVTLTEDPFVDGNNGDFRLNPAGAEYASLKGAGFGWAGQLAYLDRSATQHGPEVYPTASNVLTGSGAYGPNSTTYTPSYSPDFPDVANVRDTDTVNGSAGTLDNDAVLDSEGGNWVPPDTELVWNTEDYGVSGAISGGMGPTDIIVGEGTLAASDIVDGVILDPDGEPLEGTAPSGGGGAAVPQTLHPIESGVTA